MSPLHLSSWYNHSLGMRVTALSRHAAEQSQTLIDISEITELTIANHKKEIGSGAKR